MSDFRKDIEHAINCANAESLSDTPDFILAQYLINCLAAFDVALQARMKWYGNISEERLVTVCRRCFKACCWKGVIMCDEHINAGVIDMPIKILMKLKLEHPSYWRDEEPKTS